MSGRAASIIGTLTAGVQSGLLALYDAFTDRMTEVSTDHSNDVLNQVDMLRVIVQDQATRIVTLQEDMAGLHLEVELLRERVYLL